MASGAEETQLRENALRHQYQSAMQQERYAALMGRMEREAQTRHDIRHHLVMLRSMAADGRTQDALQYIDALLPSSSDGSQHRNLCENYAANAVIVHYAQLCEAEGIAFACRADIPQVIFVQNQDLCVLLGNLLENALEACQRQTQGERFVHVSIAMPSRDALAIRIENSYSGRIDQRHGVYMSSKHDGPGMGTASVQEIVRELAASSSSAQATGASASSFCCKSRMKIPDADRQKNKYQPPRGPASYGACAAAGVDAVFFLLTCRSRRGS